MVLCFWPDLLDEFSRGLWPMVRHRKFPCRGEGGCGQVFSRKELVTEHSCPGPPPSSQLELHPVKVGTSMYMLMYIVQYLAISYLTPTMTPSSSSLQKYLRIFEGGWRARTVELVSLMWSMNSTTLDSTTSYLFQRPLHSTILEFNNPRFQQQIFTESALRPNQSISRDVRIFVCLFVCLSVRHTLETTLPEGLETSGRRAYR